MRFSLTELYLIIGKKLEKRQGRPPQGVFFGQVCFSGNHPSKGEIMKKTKQRNMHNKEDRKYTVLLNKRAFRINERNKALSDTWTLSKFVNMMLEQKFGRQSDIQILASEINQLQNQKKIEDTEFEKMIQEKHSKIIELQEQERIRQNSQVEEEIQKAAEND